MPGGASLWNDLAAAYLERAELGSDPHDLVLSLAAATKALKKEPGLLAARFNLALVLERFTLREQAIQEWERFLRQEKDPGWSREAEAHLLALKTPGTKWQNVKAGLEVAAASRDEKALRRLLAAWPQECREYVEEEILPSWARAQLAHQDSDAKRFISLAGVIANGLVDLAGESLAADTVAQINRLRLTEGNTSRLSRLATGIRSYGDGLALVRKGSFTQALSPLQAAREALEAQGSPLAFWARCQIAYCHYQRYEYDQALRLLLPMADDPQRARFRALHGRNLWLVGLIDLIRGDLTAALTALTSASADFHHLKEFAHEAMLASLVATNLASLGRREEGWRVLYPSLHESATLNTPRIRSAIYGMATFMALDEGELDVGLRFQDEMLRSARDTGAISALAEGLFDRACILTALGDIGPATSALQEAARLLPLIPDPRTRRLTEGNVLLAEGRLRTPASPLAAIELLDRAILILRASDSHWALGQALFQRAIAERMTGHSAEVERDLSDAIGESESQRARITPLEQRISFFDQTRELVDTMVSFQLERKSAAKALAYSERARARVLMDWIIAQPTGMLEPEEVSQGALLLDAPRILQQHLPENTVVIEYWLQRKSLDFWVSRPSGLETQHLSVEASSLAALVRGLTRAAVQGDHAEFFKVSTALYEILIRPVARFLPPGCRIVFVPDGALHALSFALLRDSRTGRYVAQDHPSSVAPSAAVFAACLRRDRRACCCDKPARAGHS